MINKKCLKLIAVLMVMVLTVFSFSSCGVFDLGLTSTVAATGEFPVTVGDVEISSRPQKVLVVSPSLADVVLALQKETQLVGATDDCTQGDLTSLTKVSFSDTDAMKGLGPDLIISEPLEDSERSRLSGVATVLELDLANSREDFERLYAQVSSALSGGGPGLEEGISAARKIFTTLDDVQRLATQAQEDVIYTACYLYDIQGKAVTGDMFGTVLMSYSGLTNIFKSQTGGSYEFDTLKISDPYVIFCAPGVYDEIMSESDFAKLQAVKSKRVYELSESNIEWQGRTVITAAYEIVGLAFPELLEETSNVATDPTEDIESEVSKEVASQQEALQNYDTLQKNDENDKVYELQTRLSELGYLTADYNGFYGDNTVEAVKEFQKDNSLEETGIADGITQNKLYAADAAGKTQ